MFSRPNVDDVDLYVGALSERPESPDTVVGPTFRCLIAVQFLYYKYADRFFYENNFPKTGFTVGMFIRNSGLYLDFD